MPTPNNATANALARIFSSFSGRSKAPEAQDSANAINRRNPAIAMVSKSSTTLPANLLQECRTQLSFVPAAT
jgi:hypothetical protein